MRDALQITARLQGAISLPGGPLALDSLLAAAVAIRDNIPPATTPAEIVPIEIPIAREPTGRFHLASFSVCAFEVHERRYTNRRFPVEEAQAMGAPSIRRIDVSAGPSKSYRIPREAGHVEDDVLRWFCIGDAAEIRALLDLISYLGKKRAVGLGRVLSWSVGSCEPWDGFPVLRDGQPLRPLPPDWPGLAPDAERAYRTLTYPYWINTARVLCVVPAGSS